MNIGILKEKSEGEQRLPLTPAGVHTLVQMGATVYIEKSGGERAHFYDDEYEEAGANVVYQADEAVGRANLVLKVAPPTMEEVNLFSGGQTLFSFMHLAIAGEKVFETLLKRKVNAIGFELVEDRETLPILHAMSEIAGNMSIQVAARYLETIQGGRGTLLGGIAGVPPAAVVVLGAGVVGLSAAQSALGAGAQVIILDRDVGRLRKAERIFQKRVTTAVANEYNLQRAISYADVFIGAILLKGEKSPVVVTEDMVKGMKSGAVIIDVSIDQGGCVETSRPTTLLDPVFIVHDVIHYCVPNFPAAVARTATYGLNNGLLPYLLDISNHGIEQALRNDPGLGKGVCTFAGKCTNEVIAKRYSTEYIPLHELLIKGR